MIGCVIKKAGKVIGKESYAGEEAKIYSIIETKKRNNPDLVFEVYMDEKEFNDIKMPKEKTPLQERWDLVKESASEIEKILADGVGLK